MKGAFPRDSKLTAIAIAFKNQDSALIADSVFPRSPVGLQNFKWTEYPEAQGYTIPNTHVGEKGKVPRIELEGQERSSFTEAEGIEIVLTNNDIKNAPSGIDPKALATEHATNIVLLRREVRAAATAFNPANFGAANKIDLAATNGGNDQWDEATANPLKYLRDTMNSMLVRPNVLALGQEGWNYLSAHPKVVSAALGNEGTNGFATRQRVAELLEVNEVLVGAGWLNVAKPGQAANLARVWGKHALAFFRDSTASFAAKSMTFGLTAQWGDRIAGSDEVDVGLHGGVAVRVGEDVRELIIAPRAGFLFQNVIP